MTTEVAVIGSGLSALGAIRALLKLGHKPTVIDWGETLDPQRSMLAESLSARRPEEWTDEERQALSENRTVGRSRIPRKLLFGSDFFYGTSRRDAPVEADGNLPPFSYALGGFSVGWGGASLPPHESDLDDWPVDAGELNDYCRKALEGLPYSARYDGLSLDFDVLRDNPRALRLSAADRLILERLTRADVLEKGRFVFGQSRLLTNPDEIDGCRYCGQCMSGCVYKAIYKTNDEILRLAAEGAIQYKLRCLVREITEDGDRVSVKYTQDGEERATEFDRVFLAAGAVNSTRIVLSSLKLYDRNVTMKSRGGYVMPVLSLKKLPIDWPQCNTQPGIYLELKGGRLKHWVHVQVSTANELLLQKLGLRARKFLAEHILLMFVNFHSDYAGHYELSVSPDSTLHSRHHGSRSYRSAFLWSALRLLNICAKIGCLPLVPLARNNSGSYHVGSSLPMKKTITGDLDTDDLGRIRAWQRVHIVDTSTFPSLPGTTVGLLTMANAMRIVEKIRC